MLYTIRILLPRLAQGKTPNRPHESPFSLELCVLVITLSLSSSPSPASLPYPPYSAAMGAHRVGQRAEMLTPLMLAASAVCGAQNTAAGYASPLVGSQTTGQMQFIVHKPPLFRLGSGAVLGDGDLPEEPAAEAHLGDLRPAFGSDGSLADAAAGTDSGFPCRPNLGVGSSENRQVEATATLTLPAPLEQNSPRFFVISVLLLAVLSVLGCMMAPGAGPRMRTSASTGLENFNFRIPPGWSPEQESSYSFRAYMTDIAMWIMLTDLRPYQQCAAIIMRLGGAAREMARMVTPQEMTTGGVVNGVAVDPVTYLLGSLHARFADLEEESRLASMTEMLAFTRLPGESINALLARYETVRQRAAIEGQFVMSIEGCSLQILRACNIQSQHLLTLLQPFGGRLPQNDQQLRDMCTQLRRVGHISAAGHPQNSANVLRGHSHRQHPRWFLGKLAASLPSRRSGSSSSPADPLRHAGPWVSTSLRTSVHDERGDGQRRRRR